MSWKIKVRGGIKLLRRSLLFIPKMIWAWKRKLAWGAGILSALLIVAWIVLDIVAGAKLRRAITEWHDAGLTMDLTQFLYEPPPPEENAALVLAQRFGADGLGLAALRSLRPLSDLSDTLSAQVSRNEVSNATLGEIEAILTQPEAIHGWEVARELLDFKRFDAEHDYTQGQALPYVTQMRWIGVIAQARSVVAAARGHWEEAYQALTVSFHLSELLGREPGMAPGVVGIALQQQAFDHLERFLRTGVQDLEGVRELELRLRNADEIDLLRSFEFGAVVTAYEFFRLIEGDRKSVSEYLRTVVLVEEWRWFNAFRTVIGAPPFRPLIKADIATGMDLMRDQLLVLRSVLDDPDAHRHVSAVIGDLPWYAWVSPRHVNDYSMLVQFARSGSLRLDQARLALAIHAWRQDTNEWPLTLQDLVPDYIPEIPNDPFAGAPMRYHRTDDRVILYSIGPNLTDDGGLKAFRPFDSEPGDIVWVLDGNLP